MTVYEKLPVKSVSLTCNLFEEIGPYNQKRVQLIISCEACSHEESCVLNTEYAYTKIGHWMGDHFYSCPRNTPEKRGQR